MSDVKRFLRSVSKTQQELLQLDRQLESVLTLLTRTVKPLKEINVQSSLTNNQEDLIIKQMELLQEGERVKKELIDKHKIALEIIRRMPTAMYATIISMRYCTLNPRTNRQFTWLEIAEQIGYTEVHTKRLHGEALKEADIIFKNIKR